MPCVSHCPTKLLEFACRVHVRLNSLAISLLSGVSSCLCSVHAHTCLLWQAFWCHIFPQDWQHHLTVTSSATFTVFFCCAALLLPPGFTKQCQSSLATVPWWLLQVIQMRFLWGLCMFSRMIVSHGFKPFHLRSACKTTHQPRVRQYYLPSRGVSQLKWGTAVSLPHRSFLLGKETWRWPRWLCPHLLSG